MDTVRYEFVVSALLYHSYAVLLTGPVGTGKTSSAQSVLGSLDTVRYCVLNVNMSAQVQQLNSKVIYYFTSTFADYFSKCSRHNREQN